MEDEQENKDLLAKWLAGELSPEEREELEATLTLDDLKVVLEDIDTWFVARFETEKKLRELKEQVNKSPEKGKLISLPGIWRYAAAALLLIGVYFIIDYNRSSDLILVETEAAEQLEYYLPDSSLIILSPLSSVAYNPKKYSGEREITLKGQAYFEVGKGSLFSVLSENGKINVLGTRFDVRETGNRYTVNCFEGTVMVLTSGNETVLNALEGLDYRNNQIEVYTLQLLQPDWTEGYNTYSQADLQEVVTDINRYFNTTIDLPAQYRQLAFTGSFQHQDLETALREVFSPMGISYTLKKDNTVTFD